MSLVDIRPGQTRFWPPPNRRLKTTLEHRRAQFAPSDGRTNLELTDCGLSAIVQVLQVTDMALTTAGSFTDTGGLKI